MPLFLDKFLALLAMPLGTAIGAGLVALAALALDRRRIAGGALAFAVVWLWGWSTPYASGIIVGSLTDRYPFQRAEAMPTADAIVVLGNVGPNPSDPSYPNLASTSDRAWHAARLYRAGKAPLIVISAGDAWSGAEGLSTAHATRVVLNAFGVPDDAIAIENRSRNTWQNASFTAELAADLGIERVLLTTSAWHMPRAEAAFRRAGLEAIPAATDYAPKPADYEARSDKPWILSLLPTSGALGNSSLALREYIGFLVYSLRGWV